MKALPIGISTLKSILDDKMVYIDKTGLIGGMIEKKGRYFLSRPRRFGKSLLVDTLKEIFEGNEPLFRGLAIHNTWDWTRKYPVIKIDFAGGLLQNLEDLNNKLQAVLNRYASDYHITLKENGISNRFTELLEGINKTTNSQLVVLVDEYDKPLLDNIEDPEIAMEMREGLKNFYSPLKELDSKLQFVLLTGVSKFGKVNIFSGINNLIDLTLHPDYATICGYTQTDLETSFAEHLAGVDRTELKTWYDGYNFLGERVYNPFDILLFINGNKIYRNYWFETGTPSFLVKLFQKKQYFLPDLDNLEVGEELIGSFDIESIDPTTLLFQSGYLTVREQYVKMGKQLFRLAFPNREVKTAFNEYLIGKYSLITLEKIRYEISTYEALEKADLSGLEKSIRRLFAGIPWRNFTNNDIIEFEGYYASVLYAFFSAINCTVIPEDITNHGQADLTVSLGSNMYVMEIKVISGVLPDGTANSALLQIRNCNYAEKYLELPAIRVFELGMVFSQEKRNLVQFDWNVR